ncbi:MAG: MogA/MoaB family molybdenum cofactor biosynthesis protein [Deltaproteobacteria bacterium]|nr:MAG: MogA/MoaB family molybdenum cofactor biosynthesis protein [Deltaproteobacteria bacterium]
MYTAAVITTSDSSYQGKRDDLSGPLLRQLAEKSGFHISYTSIVPDDMDKISEEIIKCSDDRKINLILTTGGTGLGPRDVTPEATKKVIDREAPGIAELIRYETSKYTKKAYLSRGISGVRKRTLILNLSGSPKAVKECYEAVEPILDHALKIINEEITQHE